MSEIDVAAPWWMAGGVAAFWLLRETWGAILSRRKERTETDANVTLVAGLKERIEGLEASLRGIEEKLEREMELRRRAEEEAHRLRLRVQTLESALRRLGAVIPPEVAG